ncbi:AraC family transcriptional regulator [Actinomycetes bacterium M1A6_2h]
MLSTNLSQSSKPREGLPPADPLVGMIGLLRPLAVDAASLHAEGRWTAHLGAQPGVKLGVVAKGTCWLTGNGREALLLQEGDFFLVTGLNSCTLMSASTSAGLSTNVHWGGPVRVGDEANEDTYVCGGAFSFGDADARTLALLPPLVLVRAENPRGKLLAHLSALLMAEIDTRAVGGPSVIDHLTQVLFIHMLRAHAEQADQPTGWLAALADDGVGAALRALHEDVGRRWTVDQLARIARLSRSAFAAAFREKVGNTPVDYLIEWRMNIARDVLRKDRMSISQLAMAVGYESESAFSTAFRRVVGTSPANYRNSEKVRAQGVGCPEPDLRHQ